MYVQLESTSAKSPSILRTEISKHTESHLDLHLFRKEILTEFPFHLEWKCNFYLMEKEKTNKQTKKHPKKVDFLKHEFLIPVTVVGPVQHRVARCCAQERVLLLQTPQEITMVPVQGWPHQQTPPSAGTAAWATKRAGASHIPGWEDARLHYTFPHLCIHQPLFLV